LLKSDMVEAYKLALLHNNYLQSIGLIEKAPEKHEISGPGLRDRLREYEDVLDAAEKEEKEKGVDPDAQ